MREFENSVIDMSAVPAPTVIEESEEKQYEDFSQDDILELINSKDENGLCPCYILASLDSLSGVEPGMSLEDIPDENKTNVDDMQIEDCFADMYTLDGDFINIVLTFNSEKNAYLQELKRLLDRYRLMQDSIAENIDASDKMVTFSLAFMPKALNGNGLMQAMFPIAYFRTLDDTGLNVCMHIMFHLNDIQFMKVSLDDETKAEIQADILREIENGTNGMLFEEE